MGGAGMYNYVLTEIKTVRTEPKTIFHHASWEKKAKRLRARRLHELKKKHNALV
jgi:hypothetical protein